MTTKQYDFCKLYAKNQNAEKSARLAGYKTNPRKTGQMLLLKQEVQELVEELRSGDGGESSREKAVQGFKRLAFGSVTDAVRLLFMQEPDDEMIKQLDLFNVSEIYQGKDGNLEIKFFDRMKALEKLSELSEEDTGTEPFYIALREGLKSLRDGDKEDTI